MKIKKGDHVRVISGKDKAKEGVVKIAFPKTHKVVVEGVNIQTKHVKPTQQNPDGGIKKAEGKIDVSNVMLIDPKNKKQVTRIMYMINDSGKKIRFAKNSKTKIEG